MKKMRFLFILLMAIVGLSFCGCGFPTFEEDKTEPTNNTTDVLTKEDTYCTLNVIVNEGGSSSVTKKEYEAGELVELYAFSEPGYRVKGWYSKDDILLSNENTYSFIIRDNTIIKLEFIEKATLDASSQYNNDTEVSGVGKNFAILVECHEDNAEDYIRKNLHIYDEYFLDEANNVYEGYESCAKVELGKIEYRGNNMYLVYPLEDYTKSGAYVIQSSNNVTVYKKGSVYIDNESNAGISYLGSSNSADKGEGGDFTFVVGNEEHETLVLSSDVKILATAAIDEINIDNRLIEIIGLGYSTELDGEQILGGFTCDYETALKLNVGDKVIFGGNVYSAAEFDSKQITSETVFGKVVYKKPLGEGNKPIYFISVELTNDPEDYFENIDVFTKSLVELENAEFVENLEEETIKLLYRNEEFISFISAVYTADKTYNELGTSYIIGDSDINFYIKDWVITPKYDIDGSKLIIDIKGTNKKLLDHVAVGGLQGYTARIITFNLRQTLEFDVDFSWIYKEELGIKRKNGVDVRLNTTAESKFTFEVAWEGAFTSVKNHVLNTKSKVVHREDCFHNKKIKDSNKRVSTDSLENIFYSGYTPCFDCLKGSKEAWLDDKLHGDGGATYSEILAKSIEYRDFKDTMTEVTGKLQVDNAQNNAEIKLATVPVAVTSIVNCTVDLYLYFNINLKAAIKTSTTVKMKSSVGVRATLKSVKFISNLDFSLNTIDVDLTGKLRAEVGVKAAMKLSALAGQVSIKLELKAYPYIEMAGILHLDTKGDYYSGFYAEVGVGVSANVNYNLLDVVKGKLPGAIKEDIPLRKWGYDHAILGYADYIYEYSVNPTDDDMIVTLEELGLNKVRMLDVKNVTSYEDIVDYYNGKYLIDEMYLSSSDSWFEIIDYNGMKAIKIKNGAPFNENFEDIVTISIKSKNYKVSFGKYEKETIAVNLPVIKIKLIGEIKCSEHQYLYYEKMEPTCTDNGYEAYYQCSKCKKIFNGDLNAEIKEITILNSLGHNHDGVIEEKLPTCQNTGHTSGEYCTRCNFVFVKSEIIEKTNHSSSSWLIHFTPTCTTAGEEYVKCELGDCNVIIKTRPILPLGHKVDAEHNEPTCETGVKCSVCEVEIELPLGHTPGEDPTCTTDQTCTVCNKLIQEKFGHLTVEEALLKYGEQIYTKSTCYTYGYWEYDCVCGVKLKITDESIIPDHNYGELIEGTDPTCEKEGIMEHYQCSECYRYFNKNKELISTPNKPANNHGFAYIYAVKETCTNTGNIAYWKCSICGILSLDEDGKEIVSLENVITAKIPHDFKEIIRKEATCEKDGNISCYKCDNCNTYSLDATGGKILLEEDVTIVATGHTLQEVKRNEPTCTKTGNIAYWECNNCGLFYLDNLGEIVIDKSGVILSKTSHKYDMIETINPTCEADGSKTKTCICGDYQVEILVKIGHNCDPSGAGEIFKYATCTEKGLIRRVCLNPGCDGKYEDIEPLGHILSEYNVCTREGCVDINIFTSGLLFVLSNGQCYVNGFEGTGRNLQLIIPSIYQDKEVVGIKANAFADKEFLSVKLPKGIKVIEENAFKDCINLKNVNIPSTVVWLDGNAFNGCNNLKEVTIANSGNWISNDEVYDVSSSENNAVKLTINNESIYQLLTITYKDTDGTVFKIQEYKYNDIIEEYIPEKEGHTFNGWDSNLSTHMPHVNIIVKAKEFTPKKYKLHIDNDEYVFEITYGESIGMFLNSAPTSLWNKEGYRFGGFSPELPVYMPAEDIYVNRTWKKYYKLMINVEGVIEYSTTIAEGEIIPWDDKDNDLFYYIDNPDYIFESEMISYMPNHDVVIYLDYIGDGLS